MNRSAFILLILIVCTSSIHIFSQRTIIGFNKTINFTFGFRKDFKEYSNAYPGFFQGDFLRRNGNKVNSGIGSINKLFVSQMIGNKGALGMSVFQGNFKKSLEKIIFKRNTSEDYSNAGQFMQYIFEIAGIELSYGYLLRQFDNKMELRLTPTFGLSVLYDTYFEGGIILLETSLPQIDIVNPTPGFSWTKVNDAFRFDDFRYHASLDFDVNFKLYNFIWGKFTLQNMYLFRSNFTINTLNGEKIHDTDYDFVDPAYLLSISFGVYVKI